MPGSFFSTLLLLFSLQVKRDFWRPAICGRFICALTSNLHRVHFDFSSNSASTLPQWLSTDAERFCVGVNKSGTAIPRKFVPKFVCAGQTYWCWSCTTWLWKIPGVGGANSCGAALIFRPCRTFMAFIYEIFDSQSHVPRKIPNY